MSAAAKNSTAGQLAGSASPSYTIALVRVAAVETSAVDDAHAASTDGRTA